MKNLTFILGIMILISSCTFFENKEKKAIDICQKAKVQIGTDNALAKLFLGAYGSSMGLGENSTWLDYANMKAKDDVNIKYDWSANKTEEDDIYIVSFIDNKGWGYRWEVDIVQQIVKNINDNEYLSRKYGLSKFDKDYNFEITKITTDTLKLEKQSSYYSDNNSEKIVYIFKASVINRTGKTLTRASILGKLQVLYKDKTIEGESDTWKSGFKKKISKNRPWKSDTEMEFYVKTDGIEKVYLDYIPEYVFFEINLRAEDPIGFSYDKNIAEYDLKGKWQKLNQN